MYIRRNHNSLYIENLCNSHEIMLQDFQDRMNSALTTQHHKSNSTTIKV